MKMKPSSKAINTQRFSDYRRSDSEFMLKGKEEEQNNALQAEVEEIFFYIK